MHIAECEIRELCVHCLGFRVREPVAACETDTARLPLHSSQGWKPGTEASPRPVDDVLFPLFLACLVSM